MTDRQAYLYCMRSMLNPSLKILMLIWTVFAFVQPLQAQDLPPAAAPVTEVQQESLAMHDGPLVLELFSSQACVFCPDADRLFADLIKDRNVIGLACHVDYFDVKVSSLAQPFCTERQNHYMRVLGAGPNYTPQIIVNGDVDVIGYKVEDVHEAMAESRKDAPVLPLKLERSAQGLTMSWTLPETGKIASGNAAPDETVWLMTVDKPHLLSIAEGRNKGKAVTYMNIVSAARNMGEWPAQTGQMSLTTEIDGTRKAYVAIVQNGKTGRIIGAGMYLLPEIDQ